MNSKENYRAPTEILIWPISIAFLALSIYACGEIPIRTMNSLHKAAESGDTGAIKEWIESGASLDTPYNDYTISLEIYSESGARVRSKTALMFAAEKGHLEATKLLVEAGADIYVTQRYSDGYEVGTAFDLAVKYEHTKIAEYLWEKSDRKRLAAHFNLMPSVLMSLCQRPRDPNIAELVRYLFDNVVTVDQVSVALYFISRDECLSIVRSLLARGIKPSASALVAASEHGALDVMRAYFEAGIEVNALGGSPPGGFPELPLVVAAANVQPAAVRLLLDNGANPNLKDVMGHTALIAATYGYSCRTLLPGCEQRQHDAVDILKLLLNRGARVDLTDGAGRTALDYVNPKDSDADRKKAILTGVER
jgi:ankyrin repeat protein